MTPNTYLEAVNVMLSSVGETPVNSLESQNVEAEIAADILLQESRSVQAQGWFYNSEKGYRLAPDSQGEIILPNNCLRADPTDPNELLMQRGNKLYDIKNHTSIVGKTVVADLVIELAFEELPPVARQYITIKASRAFQDRVIGSETLHGFQEKDQLMALIAMQEAETAHQDFTIFDSRATTRVLDRLI